MRHFRRIPGTLTGMQLTLLPERVTLDARPQRSLLDSALMAGVPLLHSCRGGSCGACRARLVAGQVAMPHGPGLGLSDEERATGHILLCRAEPLTDVAVEVRTLRAAADIEIRRLPCRVERLERLSPDVLGVTLRLPVIEPFRWEPGQFVDLILADGTRRAYSIAAPYGAAARLELHVARVPGGAVSGALFDRLTPGALLSIEGPLGGMDVPAPVGGRLVFVAGGTGYAPLRALLGALATAGWERPTRLYFGARRGADLYADSELRALAARHPNFDYVPVSEDGAGPDDVRVGRVTTVVLEEETDWADVDVVTAGPSVMVEALRAALRAQGLAAERFYADAFG
jgi:CDP-4-dehydro-6-deoxyglucose reductase